jgi:hypothetical protein
MVKLIDVFRQTIIPMFFFTEGSVYKSSELRNYQPLPSFPGIVAAAQLPADFSALLKIPKKDCLISELIHCNKKDPEAALPQGLYLLCHTNS